MMLVGGACANVLPCFVAPLHLLGKSPFRRRAVQGPQSNHNHSHCWEPLILFLKPPPFVVLTCAQVLRQGEPLCCSHLNGRRAGVGSGATSNGKAQHLLLLIETKVHLKYSRTLIDCRCWIFFDVL